MKNRGVITLAFDDGYQAVYDEVLPLLAFYNIHAVFAVPLTPKDNVIAGEPIAHANKWLAAAQKYGHEIAAHSIHHADLTALSQSELKHELEDPSAELSTKTIVYPGGAHNDHVITSAKNFYTAGRTVLHGLETLPPKDVMRLHTINFTKKNFSVLRANIHALRAFVQNKWLIETYHFVSKKSSPLKHSTLLADLDAHLDFITSLPISIKTIQEAL
ncbi:MAG: polysaccharide deacetylase family protein [bacterium]|nr:polysaccharide deacetylase family protein [bacterium]